MLLQPAPSCGDARSLLLTAPKLCQVNVEIGLAWAGSALLACYFAGFVVFWFAKNFSIEEERGTSAAPLKRLVPGRSEDESLCMQKNHNFPPS